MARYTHTLSHNRDKSKSPVISPMATMGLEPHVDRRDNPDV
jgi:hypothetical protein